MAKNIEIQYFDGQNYEVLYPSTLASLVNGTLSTSQIPSLDMSKITTGNLSGSRISGSVSSATNASYATSAGSASTASNSTKLGGYTYSQVISNASSSGASWQTATYVGNGSSSSTRYLEVNFLKAVHVVFSEAGIVVGIMLNYGSITASTSFNISVGQSYNKNGVTYTVLGL